VAAGAAVWVTWKLGKSQIAIAAAQRDIARSQRDLAYDKLKLDLFDKRYQLYVTAKRVVEHVGQAPTARVFTDVKLIDMFVELGEAHFFFAPAEVAIFERIRSLANEYEIAVVGRNSERESKEFRAEQAKKATDTQIALVELYGQLLPLLKNEMGFGQVTFPRERNST
jgi:hypothetical protein